MKWTKGIFLPWVLRSSTEYASSCTVEYTKNIQSKLGKIFYIKGEGKYISEKGKEVFLKKNL